MERVHTIDNSITQYEEWIRKVNCHICKRLTLLSNGVQLQTSVLNVPSPRQHVLWTTLACDFLEHIRSIYNAVELNRIQNQR